MNTLLSCLVLGVALLSTVGHRVEAGFTGTDVFIPAVARASGLGGSEFYSTLWITNLSSETASFQILLLRQGQANPAPLSKADTLAGGATRRYDDIVQLFGVSGIGAALHIRSDRELFVSSRTYDQPPGTALKDVKGLFFSGIPASLAIGLGEVSRLQGVSNGPLESYRYNFGLVETTGQTVSVVVRLKNEDGTMTGSQQYDLGAFEARQVNAFAGFSPAVSTIDALLEAQVAGGAGKVLFYGTQIAGTADNPGSNDSAGFEMSFRNSLLAAGGVPSVNGITGAVTIAGGSGTTVTTNGGTITVSSTGAAGGLTLPYSGSAGTGGAAFAITNSSTGIGLQGSATNEPGVYGTSAFAGGVKGQGGTGTGLSVGRAGIHGDSASGRGVVGTSNSSVGVDGSSDSDFGAQGVSNSSTGVNGRSNSGFGVQGVSSTNTGVSGTSSTGEGVSGQALGVNTGAGVLGANDAGGIGIGVYGRAKANANRAGFFDGGITVINGAKSFVEPHPTDPTKEIRFVALEGPESGTYFRGTGRTVNGYAAIEVPEVFRMVTDERGLTVIVTPSGDLAVVACVRKSLERIEIRSSQDVEFDFMVNGVRKSLAELEPIEDNTFFVPASPNDPVLTRPLPKETVSRLISNGTLNPDGSINMMTVRRLGWDKREGWRDREPAPAGVKVRAPER